MKKSELNEIIRECIDELVTEGVIDNIKKSIAATKEKMSNFKDDQDYYRSHPIERFKDSVTSLSKAISTIRLNRKEAQESYNKAKNDREKKIAQWKLKKLAVQEKYAQRRLARAKKGIAYQSRNK